MKVLVTTTSFMDTPGIHHELLNNQGWNIDVLRGPIPEQELLPIISNYDAVLCGDDDYTEEVLRVGVAGKLRVLSKYGIGLDKINLEVAQELGISVARTPGVNHTTVAEHTFTHILSFNRNYCQEVAYVKSGQWKRITGHEIWGKTIAIFGLGRIGREVAIRAKAFGLEVMVYDPYIDMEFVNEYELIYEKSIDNLFRKADIITFHSPLTEDTKHILSKERIKTLTKNPLIVNTARAGLIDKDALVYALDNKLIAGYVCDVMWQEPVESNEILNKYDNVFITPHIGSRTFESVQRQGVAAVNNLIDLVKNL